MDLLIALNIFHTFDSLYFLDKLIQNGSIRDSDSDDTGEKAVVRINGNSSQRYGFFFIYYRGDVCDDTDIVFSDNPKGSRELSTGPTAPACADNALAVFLPDMGGIGTIATMNLYHTLG